MSVSLFDDSCKQKDRCKNLAEACPNCCLETSTVSSGHSPGVVRDDELVYRICFSPDFWDSANNTPVSAAFTEVSTSGLSVLRETYTPKDALKRHEAIRIKAKEGRSEGAILLAPVKKIRQIVHETQRFFCVYDTATEESPAHADICQAFFYPAGVPNVKAFYKDMRSQLAETFKQYVR